MDTPTPNHRAAIYARAATTDLAGSDLAIAAQLHHCREDARRVGYEVVVEVQDRGVSGATLDRPGLRALWDAIRRDNIAIVIVSSIDRLARRAADQLAIRAELKSAGVEVHIANCGTRPEAHAGAPLDQMTVIVAHFERAGAMERMAEGKRRKREQSTTLMAERPPFGYRSVGYGDDRHLEVDADQAAVVQQIVVWATGSDGSAPLPFDQVMERLRGLAGSGSQDDAAALKAA